MGVHDGCGGPPRLRVWALEPYFAGSHKYFLRGLARYSRHDVSLFTLPGRHWKWRMHGGAVSLAARVAGGAESQTGCGKAAGSAALPQVLFASDMLDLATFLALAGPSIARVPALVYFHENQLTYPLPPGVERDLGYGMKNITSALAACRILFNSDYHRRDFLSAVEGLFSALPDEIPEGVVDTLRAKAGVLPVGCDLRRFDAHRERALQEAAQGRWGDASRGPLLLWNQRWEYDKAPERFFAALRALQAAGVPFRLALAGAQRGAPGEVFLQARSEFSAHIVHWGRVVDAADYASLLWSADVVVSTAVHEFFGVALVEAIYCGCRPVLPWRLAYPELIPAEARENVLYREEDRLVPALMEALTAPRAWSENWQRTWVARFDWASLGPRYDAEIRACRDAGLGPGVGVTVTR
ncbi:MAG: tRNA-queuosine alpha-mannosyltransferase domain-containing protein [Thermoleophilia bacterium]|jgi:glycosyltransferase involved in cell wall biosynthesis